MIEAAISIAFWVSSCLTLFILCLPSQYKPRRGTDGKNDQVSVQILVLGDIGRSPRMQYHALSIARHGGQVSMIGYQGKEVKLSTAFFFFFLIGLLDITIVNAI